ncbi:MAG: aspartate aminotransferase family protein [Frankiaceae bacterium]|nr:aspartate aminotransferase family protein [Frankiaceae bacterium]MBV9869937.1 aspartate aminotransferase family protein [Frankiaceae bacterium]
MPRAERYEAALDRAALHARAWLDSLADRRIAPGADADSVLADLGGSLPDGPTDPAEVVDRLAAATDAGLMAMPAGRFYGWVIGGTLPAALGADWLVSAWDQNSGMRNATPGVVAAEEAAASWLLDLLGLPVGCDVGFVTGATMANFTCLSAARYDVLARAGWDVNERGLQGSPPVRVIVGDERHATIDLALRYLGLGKPTAVAADRQGRIVVDALAAELARNSGPTVVCLQAGNLHSGAFDAIADAAAVAHEHGAWVHVDGAFGLWAAASSSLRHHLAGHEAADSWATDAHKTLNVPYDCGVAIVADPVPLRAAMGTTASYLIAADDGPGDPLERVPEFSRRARGVPVWAALKSLGRSGVEAMVDGFVRHARALAAGIADLDGAEILNDVDFTQVCVSFGTDERTREVTARLLADGAVWMSGSRWRGRDVLRISVSNWSTDESDVAVSIDAVKRAAAHGRLD